MKYKLGDIVYVIHEMDGRMSGKLARITKVHRFDCYRIDSLDLNYKEWYVSEYDIRLPTPLELLVL